MRSERITIPVDGGEMPAYLARPDTGAHPAVIVLEGVYGFDDELLRITDLLASVGYAALAIQYFHRIDPNFQQPFSEEGRAAGNAAAAKIDPNAVIADVGHARDWLNHQEFVDHNKIGLWGFGLGGTMAFLASSLPGISATVAFYGQSIARPLPSGAEAPVAHAAQVRAPILLIFGGLDEQISMPEIARITEALGAAKKRFDVQVYPTVGHSFFRENIGSATAAETADAWERARAWFRRAFTK